MVVYDRRLKHIEYISTILDNRFSVMGKSIGLDPFLDFIPVVGSYIGLLISLYVVWFAFINKVRYSVIVKMLILVAIDYMLGLIPVVGILADALFQANRMNIEMLKKEFGIEEIV